MAEVIIHRQGVAGRITLNRPQALHALNEEMCLAMDAALKPWADDPEVELVVVDHAAGHARILRRRRHPHAGRERGWRMDRGAGVLPRRVPAERADQELSRSPMSPSWTA